MPDPATNAGKDSPSLMTLFRYALFVLNSSLQGTSAVLLTAQRVSEV